MFYLAGYFILYSVVVIHKGTLGKKNNALYEGAQVWKTHLRSSSDIVLLKRLMDNQDVSIWQMSPKRALFLVQMHNKLKVNRELQAQQLNHTVLVMDVQRRIEEQGVTETSWDKHALRRGHRMNWGKYPTVEVINEYLDYLAKQYPSVCKQEIIGHSVENRIIQMIKISNGNPSNKGIMVVGGQHAREWSAITSALVVLREIVTNFDEQSMSIRNKDWYIIPMLNPDGYRYSYLRDRFWRKNRRWITNCFGVDLNRNYGSNFNLSGITDHNECRESYSGPNPFSEPETLALRNTTLKLKARLSAVVDLHAFGQLILFPWSGSSQITPDFHIHNATAAGMSKAIIEYKMKKFTFGPTYHLIYPASGSLLDWIYSNGIRHSYVIEGRDKGQHGFLLPPEYIQEAGQEMLRAVGHLASVVDRTQKRMSVGTKNANVWF